MYSRCPLANLQLDADSYRGRRSHPSRAEILKLSRTAGERQHSSVHWPADRIDLQPMPVAQVVGDRPQRTVALVRVEAEHYETWLGVDPQSACTGGDFGYEGIAGHYGVEAAGGAHRVAQGVEADEIAAQSWVSRRQPFSLLGQGRSVARDLRDDRRGRLRTKARVRSELGLVEHQPSLAWHAALFHACHVEPILAGLGRRCMRLGLRGEKRGVRFRPVRSTAAAAAGVLVSAISTSTTLGLACTSACTPVFSSPDSAAAARFISASVAGPS